MLVDQKEWYSEWFNSPYYHILYKNRDEKEAEFLLTNLSRHLQFRKEDRILDVACGRGRHAIYLNSIGFDVFGIDLSPESISYAKQFENERLHFAVKDMRHIGFSGEFDYVLNVFTSFGYFQEENDNLQAVKSMAGALKPGGTLVMDFMNSEKTLKELVKCEVKEEDGIKFFIERTVKDAFLLKKINFKDQGIHYAFEEKVKPLTYSDFIKYFNFAGLSVKEVFGDYSLNPFDSKTSDRMIFITEKN
ncbi:MAG TPA: class I SAM-dependent methyltransferase [Cytophagaceae bacterium]